MARRKPKKPKRHKITFIKRDPAISKRREVSQNWIPIYEDVEKASSWASFEPLRGRSFWAAQQNNSEIKGRIFVWYRDDIEPDHRIQFGNRQLEILHVINVEEKNQELLIYYKETQ